MSVCSSNRESYQRTRMPLRVEFPYGASSRTRPLFSFLRRSASSSRRPFLLWEQTPLSSRKTSRRHCSSRRAHHFLFSHRHLPSPQRCVFPPLLAHLPLPSLINAWLNWGSLAAAFLD